MKEHIPPPNILSSRDMKILPAYKESGIPYPISSASKVLDALSEEGIQTYSVSGDDFSEQNGYIESKLLLQKKNKPTAMFALSNTIAMGCLKAFKEENVKLPDDISLIAFDENPYINYIDPPSPVYRSPWKIFARLRLKCCFQKSWIKRIRPNASF